MRTLVLFDTKNGQSVYLQQEEVKDLASLGLKVRRLGNGDYSQIIEMNPENKIILEKAEYSFRVPKR